MGFLRIANLRGWGLMIAVVSLLFASVACAAEMKNLTQNMPRVYFGEFRWDGDKTVQNVVLVFEPLRALNEHNAEALGCGTYKIDRLVTKIDVRMLVRLSDLQVKIFELSPDGSPSFETGGSHLGKLSEDLQQIDAQWTTLASGQHGQLHLRAAVSDVTCAPPAST